MFFISSFCHFSVLFLKVSVEEMDVQDLNCSLLEQQHNRCLYVVMISV